MKVRSTKSYQRYSKAVLKIRSDKRILRKWEFYGSDIGAL